MAIPGAMGSTQGFQVSEPLRFVADCCKSRKGECPSSGFNYFFSRVEFQLFPLAVDEAGSVLRVIFAVDDNFSAPLTASEVTRSAGLL
jgi:hypothetical protein